MQAYQTYMPKHTQYYIKNNHAIKQKKLYLSSSHVCFYLCNQQSMQFYTNICDNIFLNQHHFCGAIILVFYLYQKKIGNIVNNKLTFLISEYLNKNQQKKYMINLPLIIFNKKSYKVLFNKILDCLFIYGLAVDINQFLMNNCDKQPHFSMSHKLFCQIYPSFITIINYYTSPQKKNQFLRQSYQKQTF
eukprot:TRINITY_DN7348_c0_g1_i2.p1 TRINITY_DN7348_c0_g1~~TRINITY_DN7348_c0_g1_i2.p1  ORF type:complete len:189 (+),score=-19.67 TRINITY_DN7348_c0_g1_i2:914-1480(+)